MAEETFRKFIRMLESKLKCRISHVAVPERTTSGLGKPSGPWHWHFMLCGPEHKAESLLLHARLLWTKLNGNGHIEPYDREQNGARYIAKTAAAIDFAYIIGNLEFLAMPTAMDMFEDQQIDPYVPDHVRHKLTGPTLRLSRCGEHLNCLDKSGGENGRNR